MTETNETTDFNPALNVKLGTSGDATGVVTTTGTADGLAIGDGQTIRDLIKASGGKLTDDDRVKVKQYVGSAISFEQLDIAEHARELTDDLWDITWAFQCMSENILFDTFVEDKAAAIASLITEMLARVRDLSATRSPNGEQRQLSTDEDTTEDTPQDQPHILDPLIFDPDGSIDLEKNTSFLSSLASFITGKGEGKPEFETLHESDSFRLEKSSSGEHLFFGRMSNNFRDREGQIITAKAHQEYVEWLDTYDGTEPAERLADVVAKAESYGEILDWLDTNPAQPPELWFWHIDGTQYKQRATWWDYSDGFLQFMWPLTESEAMQVKSFIEENDPAMSHGFVVLDYDANDDGTDIEFITQYRSYEGSILPLEAAANSWTNFDLVTLAKEFKAMTPEKRAMLEKYFEPEKVDKIVAGNQAAQTNLMAAGIDSKEATDEVPTEESTEAVTEEKQETDMEDQQQAAEATDEVVDEAAAEATEEVTAEATDEVVPEATPETSEDELTAIVAQGFKAITDNIGALAATVGDIQAKQVELEQRMDEAVSEAATVDEAATAKSTGTSRAGLVAMIEQLTKGQSVVGLDATRIDGRTTISKAGPKETKPADPKSEAYHVTESGRQFPKSARMQ